VATVLSGAINTTGCIFIAKGSAPTTWTNASSLTQLGATLSLEAKNAYSDKWLSNSNGYVATPVPLGTGSSPIVLTSDDYKAETRLEDYNLATINGTNTTTFSLPAGYYIDRVQIGNKTAASMGVTSVTVAGLNILSGKNVAANSMGLFTLLGDQVLSTAAQSVVITTTTTLTTGMSIVLTIKRQA
jgi:hypothetical protein